MLDRAAAVQSSCVKKEEKRLRHLKDLYMTTGKLICMVLRGHRLRLPQLYSSPLLIHYLLGGSEGVRNARHVTADDIKESILGE